MTNIENLIMVLDNVTAQDIIAYKNKPEFETLSNNLRKFVNNIDCFIDVVSSLITVLDGRVYIEEKEVSHKLVYWELLELSSNVELLVKLNKKYSNTFKNFYKEIS